MELEFDVKLTSKDMYRFNMFHVYGGFHGIFSIIIAILAFTVAVTTWGEVEVTYSILYIVFGILFIFYMPVNLLLKSKHQFAVSKELQSNMHYEFNETCIQVSIGEDKAELPWEQVYKMVATKNNILIYSNRVNAYVVPRRCVGDQYDRLQVLAKSKLEKFRVRMK